VDSCLCYRFKAFGHVNVRAKHKSTLEVTVDEYLTPRGDCIIGIKAPHGAAGLPENVKAGLRKGWNACLVIRSGAFSDVVCGRGDERLILSDSNRMIFRKSRYVEPATVFIDADKSAGDLDRRLVKELARGASVDLVLIVYPP
jgi:hypothetical protein